MNLLRRTITAETLAAWFLWVAAGTLTIGDAVGFMPEDTGFVGIVTMALAHLLCVHHIADRRGEDRERHAFELGREAGRAGRSSQIHPVQ